MWKRIKSMFGRKDKDSEGGFRHEDFKEIEDTPWGVPVIDVQPLTQHVTSASQDPTCASNAVSYRGDDGPEFALQKLESDRLTACVLRLPIDTMLVDGVIASPQAMEDKWAIYLEGGRLLFVRSWLRQVIATADVRVEGGEAVIGPVHGAFTGGAHETPEYTRRVLEYLIRDIGLGEGLPTPLPHRFEDHSAAAMYCFSVFGHQARFATHYDAQLPPPSRPLCAHTRLHIATARAEVDRISEIVEQGVPPAARGPDGLTALHWAAGGETVDVAAALLNAGAPVGVRSRQEATPLMQAVQSKSPVHVQVFLDHGADPNAVDHRGFTALHRAAEMGQVDVVKELLAAGARVDVEAEGHTPESLAKGQGQTAIVELLRG